MFKARNNQSKSLPTVSASINTVNLKDNSVKDIKIGSGGGRGGGGDNVTKEDILEENNKEVLNYT